MYKENKNNLRCNIHGLDFDYPSEWHELHLPPPECPICAIESRERLRGDLETIKSQRDTLLNAIEIKINTVVDK